jgi:predicted lipase
MQRGLAFYNDLLYYALVSKLAYNTTNSIILHRLQITSDIQLIRNDQSRCVIFRKDGKLIIGFAGTYELRNWCINLRAHKTPYVCGDSNVCGKIHAGFGYHYRSISQDIIEHANRYIQDATIENKQIVFAGHSRGGSCILAALDVSYLPHCPEIVCYTYGSPRIGDALFASEFEKRIKRCYRVTNRFDLVTTLPAYIGFRHVGVSVHVDQAEFRLDGWVHHHKLSTYISFLERYIAEKNKIHEHETPTQVDNNAKPIFLAD